MQTPRWTDHRDPYYAPQLANNFSESSFKKRNIDLIWGRGEGLIKQDGELIKIGIVHEDLYILDACTQSANLTKSCIHKKCSCLWHRRLGHS